MFVLVLHKKLKILSKFTCLHSEQVHFQICQNLKAYVGLLIPEKCSLIMKPVVPFMVYQFLCIPVHNQAKS